MGPDKPGHESHGRIERPHILSWAFKVLRAEQ